MTQATRRATTLHGLITRLTDAGFDKLPDVRSSQGRRIPFRALLLSLMLGLATAGRSLREVEHLTSRLPRRVRRASGIAKRVSDTKLRDTLLRLNAQDAREALHRQVRAEHRRGQLRPDGLPISLLAIDGKGLAKLDQWGHPNIQKIEPSQGLPYGLARAHRAVLVSSKAAVCVDSRPIPGDTNEIGALPDLLDELHQVYGRTRLFDTVIADAGNTSQSAARWLDEHLYGYILTLKENHGEIHLEATRALAVAKPSAQVTSRERGANVTYRHPLADGYLSWTHARQIVRVQRLVERGERGEGNRYFVSNLPYNQLCEKHWLKAIRCYWRVENSSNWTADVFWYEDAKRTPWTTNPEAVYVMAALRMLAINIIAVLRAMAHEPGLPKGKLQWKVVIRRMASELTAHDETSFDAATARV